MDTWKSRGPLNGLVKRYEQAAQARLCRSSGRGRGNSPAGGRGRGGGWPRPVAGGGDVGEPPKQGRGAQGKLISRGNDRDGEEVDRRGE